MDDRIIHFRLGLFVVIVTTALMMITLVYLFGELPTSGQKEIFVRFESVPGVTEETPVRKNGILIGRVRRMAPVDSGVVLTLAIDPRWTLSENEVCRIKSDNLFGDSVLEFVASGQRGASHREIQDGEYMNGIVASNPMEAMSVVVDMREDFNNALRSIQAAGEEVGGVAESLNLVVQDNQQQFNRILGQTERALNRFDTAMVSINQVVSNEDLQLALEEALEGVPRLVNDAGRLMKLLREDADEILSGIGRVTVAAEENLVNLKGLTKPLGESGEEITGKLNRSLGDLEDVVQNLKSFGEKLNSGQGTVGQLVSNPELYQNLNRAAQNIEGLSRQLRPIVADARVAMDKVARNPRMLGVQGALQRQTSGLK